MGTYIDWFLGEWFGAILTIVFCLALPFISIPFLIFYYVTSKKYDIRLYKNEIYNIKNRITELKENEKKLTNDARELKSSLNFNKDKYAKIIDKTPAECEKLKLFLEEKFSFLLLPIDWGNIDLIIFYLQTSRADTIKEALYQVDRQRQADMIAKEIKNGKRTY